jgi:N-methylhydantoinase B
VWVSFSPSAGGGAVHGLDGYQSCACGSTLGNIGKTNIEDEMLRFPWEYRAYEFVVDNEGAGQWRGAPGIRWEVENHAGRSLHQTGSWDGFLTQGEGAQGGENTPLNVAHIKRAGGGIDKFESKDFFTEKGDVLVTKSGGGAGVGNPAKRDIKAVQADVRNDLVSVERAGNVYKVVINPETLEVDESATASLRG